MPKTKKKGGTWIWQGPPFDIEFKGKFRGVEMFLACSSIGGFKFKSGVLGGFCRECERCARGKIKAVENV